VKKLKNVDANERLLLARTVGFALYGGGGVGAAAGGLLYGLPGVLVGAPLGFGLVFLVGRMAANASGRAASSIYAPSGDSTPAKREYSRPQALVAHGHYEEAIQAYELCCAEFPGDPEPYVRIARLYRDELQRFEDAVSWFKKARSQAKLTAALEQLVTQEIVEVYTHKLATPRRAMPELARLADQFPGSEAAIWAKQRLEELRHDLAREHDRSN
jgi:tetratricopeptide (TPR) repeat protein